MFHSRCPYALSILLCAVLVLASSYSQAKSGPSQGLKNSFVGVPGATTVGSETCNSCHSDEVKDFRNAFHAREGVQCEDCHGGGSQHIESGATAKIVSFTQRPVREANSACLSCHAQSDHVRNWQAGAHARNGVRCMDCHQVHAKARQADATAAYRLSFISMHPGKSSASDNLLGEDRRSTESLELSNAQCLRCHQSVRGQMNLPSHHPLREGKVGCKDCHDVHGGPGGNGLRTSTSRELCLTCHAQYRGPFAFQHRPVQEDCLTCHSAHGSPNLKLTKVSQPALCLQCHSAHEGQIAAHCTDCHGSIHGSEVTSTNHLPVFLDNSYVGMPTRPAQGTDVAFANAHRSSMKMKATALPAVGAGLATASALESLVGSNPGSGDEMTVSAVGVSASSVSTSYRFMSSNGFRGRVGQYDSLQESVGAQAQNTVIFNGHDIAIKSRASIISSDDYHIASDFIAAHRIRAGFDARSLVQQQTTNLFDIEGVDIDNYIPDGSEYGIKRRMGKAYANVDLPTKIPVELFVKGDWQARVGTMQLQYNDQGGAHNSPSCASGACHYTSQFQPLNQTTRGISGGARVKLGTVALAYEHGQNSFNNRLEFPFGTFVPNRGEIPEGGNAYIRVLPPNSVSSDTARLSWVPSPNLTINGDVTYSRLLDRYLDHKGNTFTANTTLTWRPVSRLGLTADYHQDNLINSFIPVAMATSYAPVPQAPTDHHRHWEGLRADYDLTNHFNAELYYKHGGVTRSDSENWCLWARYCSYGPGADETETNTVGAALRFRSSQFSTRMGYEYINTDGAGYNTDFGSDNRAFVHSSFSPTPLLTFTNDFDVRIKNAYPYSDAILWQVPARSWMSYLPEGTPTTINNHFYSETLAVSMPIQGYGTASVGYSYQQTKMLMPMDWLYDYGFGLNQSLEQASTPYNQLSQTYWADISGTLFHKRLGMDARVDYNSARSRFYPDLNPDHFLQLGNQRLVDMGGICPNGGVYPGPANCFTPRVFAHSLEQLGLAATSISEVNVPQWVGQGKVYYRLPRSFTAGLLFNYGSYRDYWNSGRNGVLRSFNLYIGRSW